MILNKAYYQSIWEKFEYIKTINVFNNNSMCLATKIILEFHQKSQSIHINFQNSKEAISEIGKHIFVELANDIYINHYDLPNLAKGSKLRDKRIHTDGKKHDYIIKSIGKDTFLLEDTKNKAQSNLKYDVLVKKFIPIEQGTKQTTLQNYTNFFAEINGELKLEFTPTHFEKKCVFIGKKTTLGWFTKQK